MSSQKNVMYKYILVNILLILTANSYQKNDEMNIDDEILYRMPEESEPHEGTWLQWPHHSAGKPAPTLKSRHGRIRVPQNQP